MLPFLGAFNAFALIFTLLPLAMKSFVVLYLIFFVVFGAVKEYLNG